MLKKVLHIILVSLAITAMLAVCVLAEVGWQKTRLETKCKGLRVCVTDSSSNKFLTAKDVVRIIDKDFGGYTNRDIARIDLHSLEKLLASQGYITFQEAYFTTDGMLNVNVRQMTPAMKMRKGSSVWYLDTEGRCVKVQNDWCESLPEVSGEIRVEDAQWVSEMAEFAGYCKRTAGLWSRISGLRCYEDGKVTMMLRDRDEVFDFGKPVELKGKFRRMDIYEKKIRPVAEKEYKKVNLRYNGQIVCK